MKVCSVNGCGKKHAAKGYCAAHYQKLSVRPSRKVNRSEASKNKTRLRERFRHSGFTQELLTALRLLQEGKCAVCKVTMVPGRNSADGECCDHDHLTNKPRGLLCRRCNAQLGFYEKIKDQAEMYLNNTPVSQVTS